MRGRPRQALFRNVRNKTPQDGAILLKDCSWKVTKQFLAIC
jgi:hypothetical protein